MCFVENVAFLKKNNVKEEEEEEAKTERKNCDRNCLGGVHDCCCLRERAGELTASACSTPLCPNSPPPSLIHRTPPSSKPPPKPRRFSHYSLDSAEAVRRCLVIHSIIIFDYYNSLHFIFRKFMQLNLNQFIKQIVTTLCLAVETFVFSFSIVTLWGSALSPPTRPHSATNCQNSFKAEKLFILETKKCRCVCFCLLISCFHVNLVSFLFPLESGGLPRTTASVFS